MEDLKYKRICDKLGFDLRYEPLPMVLSEYDKKDGPLYKLNNEELNYLHEFLKKHNLKPKIRKVDSYN